MALFEKLDIMAEILLTTHMLVSWYTGQKEGTIDWESYIALANVSFNKNLYTSIN